MLPHIVCYMKMYVVHFLPSRISFTFLCKNRILYRQYRRYLYTELYAFHSIRGVWCVRVCVMCMEVMVPLFLCMSVCTLLFWTHFGADDLVTKGKHDSDNMHINISEQYKQQWTFGYYGTVQDAHLFNFIPLVTSYRML